MRPMRTSAIFLRNVALALGALASPAAAQSPPFDSAIDVQTFEYAIGPKTFFTVANADVADEKQLAVDAVITFLSRPFSIYNVDPADPNMVGDERTTVVESMTAMQLTAAYGINEKLQIGANLPVIFQLTGDGLMANTGNGAAEGLNVTGLGDLLVEGKYVLHRKNGLRLAGIGGLTLPSSFGSNDSQFIGDNLPSMRARIAAQYDTGKFSVGVNGGVILRKPRTIYNSTIGQQLTWGVAAAVRVTDRFSLIGEGYGRAGLPDFSLDASPFEAQGGLRIYVKPAVAVVVGGGAGISKGIGSPEARFFVSLGYAPDVRDSDGDGLANTRDKCPLVAEDKDGSQDDDGCPDDDSDGDRRADAEDKCPTQPEDLDGFDDDDGCPELDNDGDKLADLQDKCPNAAEDGLPPAANDGCPASKRDSDADGVFDDKDKCASDEEDVDGFEDGDGCPEADNDNDGVKDDADKCPLCPEDKDGHEDGDGCLDLDNDQDGVADTADKCPAQPETINGVKDEDGCPDTGGAGVRLEGDRLIVDRVPTLAGSALSPTGRQIADQIALVMLAHPEVTQWLLALSQPKDAQKLADAVRDRLVSKGLAADRLKVHGATGPAKIGGVVQERGAADAVPACPAGREIKQRPGTEGAASAPALPPAAKSPEPDVEIDN